LSAGWNFYLSLRHNICDSLALQYHNLSCEHLTGLTVEKAAGAHSDCSGSGSTLKNAAIGTNTRCRTGASPWGGRRLDLRD
jgi:hypothetical protein